MSDPNPAPRKKRAAKPAASDPKSGAKVAARTRTGSRTRRSAPKADPIDQPLPTPVPVAEPLAEPASPTAPVDQSGANEFPEGGDGGQLAVGSDAVAEDAPGKSGTEASPQAATSTSLRTRVDARILLQAVEKVATAAAGSRDSNPVLQNLVVMADTETDSLTLAGYNLNVALQVVIQEAQVKQSGEFLISPTVLKAILSQMPEDSYLELDSSSQPGVLQISCAGICYQEQVSHTDHYPELPGVPEPVPSTQQYQLNAAELALGLSSTRGMISSDEESVLSGLLLQLWRGLDEGGDDGFAVCGAHKGGMALYTVTEKHHGLMQPNFQVLLPPVAETTLRKLCYGSASVNCQFDGEGKLMRLSSRVQNDDTTVYLSAIVRLREGASSYPNLRQHLPDPNREQVVAVLDYRQLLEAMVRQEATQGFGVELKVSFQQLSLMTQGTERGRQVNEQIGADNSGVGMTRVPIKMLAQACKALECEQVRLTLDSQLPASVRVADGYECRLTLSFIDRPLEILMMRLTGTGHDEPGKGSASPSSNAGTSRTSRSKRRR